MTFQELVSNAKTKYKTTNDIVIFEVLHFLSKKVKDKLTFTQMRKSPIDFNLSKFDKLLSQYFTNKKPLGAITKKTQFYGLNIEIFHKIFNPRSETELLCEKVIQLLNKDKTLINGLDLCCGTGIIGLAIKNNCPHVQITSIDINKTAIENTIANAKLNNLHVKTIKGDFYKVSLKHKTDFIVCNPPYVNMKDLDKTMIKYETKISFNNGDILFFYEQIINNYKKIISNINHFLIAFEIGFDLKPQITKLLITSGLLEYSKFYKDYSRFDRILIIKKNI